MDTGSLERFNMKPAKATRKPRRQPAPAPPTECPPLLPGEEPLDPPIAADDEDIMHQCEDATHASRGRVLLQS